MTPLGNIIRDEILSTGPISISRYMELCLGHPDHGYYTTRNPIGAAGDFTTAPEISQLFGEMIGIWLLQTWADQGAPKRFSLAELGPGRGTLMADILRVVTRNPDFRKAMNICLVETSPSLRKIQAKALIKHDISFLDDVTALPDAPVFMVANEFFDALPMQQFVKTDIGWQERLVDVSTDGFRFVLAQAVEVPELEQRNPRLANGIIVERSAISEDVAAAVGQKIQSFGGSALIIDYGNKTGVGDTFQAVKDHSSSNPLTDQGLNDLTSHVQFQPLIDAANCAVQFSTQGEFLENMGITARAQALAGGLSEPEIETLVASHRRLVHPDEMGGLFKVVALRPKNSPPTTGF